MFYVYAIESIKTGRIYIGQTKDIEIRLRIHNKSQVKSTAKEIPWKIIAFEKFWLDYSKDCKYIDVTTHARLLGEYDEVFNCELLVHELS